MFCFPHRSRPFCALAALVILAGSCQAQSPVYSSDTETGEVPGSDGLTVPKHLTVKMRLHPAHAPVPAMKYALLPEVRDMKPGNAALLYQRAHSLEWWSNFIRTNEGKKIYDLLEMPIAKMPKDRSILLTGPLAEMDLAARRENCDWELTPRLREDGFMLLLPDIQGFRTFGQMLALRARLDIQNGKVDQAIHGLQTGFAMSRHLNDAPILINSLVGMAVAETMLNQVEELMQMEKAPNLYWSLADLPRPYIDLRRPMQGEKVSIDSLFPEIRAALNDPNLPPISVELLERSRKKMQNWRQGTLIDSVTFWVARIYPSAKKYLLENGFSVTQVEAMPVYQASLMYSLKLFDKSFDELYRWQSFPYWQARRGLNKEEEEFRRLRTENWEAMAFAFTVLPGLNRVMFAQARLDRHLAILQVVEALRLYAAHEGKLPDSLEDMHAVPIPIDPVTGKAFQYTLEENRVILYAPPPAGETASDRNALRYELTFVLPAKN